MNALTGTTHLLRLALRRDRFILAGWVAALAALPALFALAFAHDLPTHADVLRETRLMAGNAGFRMLSLSPGASVGAYAMNRGFITLAVLAAVMSITCVVRHSRQNEETGRAELLGAAVVGPAAGLAAAVLVALGADLVLAPLTAVGLIAAGQPAAGSLAAGAAIAAVGVVFTGVAALTAQLSRSARGASALAVAALAVSFLVSGVGNMLGHTDATGTVAYSAWPGWLTPLGWGYQLRPFGAEQWWVLLLPGTLAAVLLLAAGRLVAHRDLGAGVLPERAGRTHASPLLRGPASLAWRLQRPAFLGWLATLIGFGLIFGSVSKSAGKVFSASGAAAGTAAGASGGPGAPGALDAWFGPVVLMGGIAGGIYVVQAVLRTREEEASGRLEPVLAAAVGRPRWMLAHLAGAAVGAAVLLLAYAGAAGATAALATGDAGIPRELAGACLAELPAVLVVAATVAAIVALLPRRAVAMSWVLLAAAVFLSPLFQLDLPQWLLDASPFTHQPAPTVEVSAGATVALLALAGALGGVALACFRRRDLAA
jgi:ABC-2 type transport system permease protein